MVKYDLGSVIGPKGDTGASGPQGPQGTKGDKGKKEEKGDSATATPLTNTVSSSDTSHAVTGKAVSDYVSSIIGDAINYINR